MSFIYKAGRLQFKGGHFAGKCSCCEGTIGTGSAGCPLCHGITPETITVEVSGISACSGCNDDGDAGGYTWVGGGSMNRSFTASLFLTGPGTCKYSAFIPSTGNFTVYNVHDCSCDCESNPEKCPITDSGESGFVFELGMLDSGHWYCNYYFSADMTNGGCPSNPCFTSWSCGPNLQMFNADSTLGDGLECNDGATLTGNHCTSCFDLTPSCYGTGGSIHISA